MVPIFEILTDRLRRLTCKNLVPNNNKNEGYSLLKVYHVSETK